MEFFSKVFWFTLEFGVLFEDGVLKAYGAGLLSSYGELDAYRDAEVRAWNLLEMGTRAYDITHYQPVLYASPSFEQMVADLGEFFRIYDELWYRQHVAPADREAHREDAQRGNP